MTTTRRWVLSAVAILLTATIWNADAEAQTPGDGEVVLGVQLRIGGRYDNVRMCVASPAGSQGGPAADISFFVEVGLTETMSIAVNIPVFRPVLFGAAFGMLQLEPDVTLRFRVPREGRADFIYGPSLGLSLHYGRSYHSGLGDEARGPSFFAAGPVFGFYLGADFVRPDERFNFQLGFRPYITPLIPTGEADVDTGIVVGGTVDGVFRFNTGG